MWAVTWACGPSKVNRARASRNCGSPRKATGICARCWCGGAHLILNRRGSDADLKRWGLKLASRGGKNAKKARDCGGGAEVAGVAAPVVGNRGSVRAPRHSQVARSPQQAA
jgi:hypothetical protein